MPPDANAQSPFPASVDFWFDPVCPWTWLTSRWLLEVEQVRPVAVRFHLMSLSALNEDRTDVTEFYQRGVRRWWGPVRVMIAAEKKAGNEVIRPLYTALGTRIHRQGQRYDTELYEMALGEVGLDRGLAEAAEDTTYDDAIRASHNAAALRPGDDELGSPKIHLPGPDGDPVAVFGPVVSPMPEGEAAGRLWDAVTAAVSIPGFSEIKTRRDRNPALC
ncbi:MAG: disulfide bond formation protein DsbA [Stackebrandtia sp.]